MLLTMHRSSPSPVARLARLALLCVCLLSAPAGTSWAQDGDEASAPIPTPVAPEQHFQSPKALVEWVLANQADVEALRAAFDSTSHADVLAATREERERRLVRDLLRLFELRGQPELSALPALGDARLESGSFQYGHVVRGLFTMTPYELGFSRDQDGRWRFDRATELRIEGAYRAQLAELNGLRHYVPERLQRTGFMLEHWQWFGLGVLLFIAVALDRLSRLLSRVLLRRLLGASRALDVDVKLFVRPVGLFIGAFAFRSALDLLDLELGSHGALVVATGFVLTVAGVWATWCLVDVFCGLAAERASRTDHKFDDMLVPLLRRTLKLLVVAAAVVYIASLLSEKFWSVLAGLSLGSVAIGFAAKDSLENLFGTFTVLLDKPFQLGDWIRMGDVDGSVEEVGMRSTRVRTFYNSLISIPNSTFISQHVDNMGARRYRRIKTTLALTYDTPPEKVEAFCEGVRELVRTHPFTRKDYYHVYLTGLGDSALEVMLYCFVEVPDWATELREKHRLLTDVMRLAGELGVEFAFPTQSLHVAQFTPPDHADRPGDVEGGLRRGRSLARSIARAGLSGLSESRPPPPGFEGADPDWRLHGSDGVEDAGDQE